MISKLQIAVLSFLWLTAPLFAQTYNSVWDASNGVFPDSVCPKWSVFDSVDPENPSFEGDTLLTSSSSLAGYMFYYLQFPTILRPDTFVVEFRMKYVTGAIQPGWPRTACAVSCVVDSGIGTRLYFGADNIYLWSGFEVIGPAASVDTDDAFHTYRLEVDDTDTVRAYQDNILILTGACYSHINNGPHPEILWGDGTDFARATTKWMYLKHNAYAFAADTDQDAYSDSCDNCVSVPNPTQSDCDFDGIGDACDYLSGDADNNGIITISDAVLLINYIFSGGPAPCPLRNGDADCNAITNISDAVYLINYIFAGGPAPC